MKYARLFIATLLSLVLSSTSAWATDVTLRLVDQNSNLIAASKFIIDGSSTVTQGGTIKLSEGDYTVRLLPGLNGRDNDGLLCRNETITVTGTNQTIEFEWQTETFQYDIVDQFGVPIPASVGVLNGVGGHIHPGVPLPTLVVLPVTVGSDCNPFQGGYRVVLWPGLDGNESGNGLGREDQNIAHGSGGTDTNFVWVTATLTILDIVDQNGASIPESRGRQNPVHPNLGILFPISVVLPVTDLYSDFSTHANGYTFTLYPGMNGNQNVNDVTRVDFLQLPVGDASYTLEWRMADVAVHLVDQNGLAIPNSQVGLPRGSAGFEVIPAGSTMRLPVTEDPTHSEIGGASRDGYDVRLLPGLNGLEQFNGLFRDNEDLPELTVTGLDFTFEWIQLECAVTLVDGNENVIPGSIVDFGSISGPLFNGDIIVLPIINNTVYPKISAPGNAGYVVTLSPGGVFDRTIQFTMTTAPHEFFPRLDTLDGRILGLRCAPPEISFRLVDQNGALIPASTFDIDGNSLGQDEGITLAPGTYTVKLLPGLNGTGNNGRLCREETITVTGSSQTIEFVWQTATLSIDLVDQFGVQIPASRATLVGYIQRLALPGSFVLPVTVDPTKPPPTRCPFFDSGYRIVLFPGLDGKDHNDLFREEKNVALPVGGASYTFVWKTATLQLADLVDQDGISIAGSRARLNLIHSNTAIGVSFPIRLESGGPLVLPVTEDSTTSPIGGGFGAGYTMLLLPGIDGFTLNFDVYRVESAELPVGGATYTFEWQLADVTLHLVDQNGVTIPNSKLPYLRGPAFQNNPSGGTMRLPVTEDPSKPTIIGGSSNGYFVRLLPGLNGREQFDELFRDHVSLPELTIAGLEITFEWIQLECAVTLVDGNGNVIPESFVDFTQVTDSVFNGDVVVLPATFYADIVPAGATYGVKFYPSGVLVASNVRFGVTATPEFDPPFVTLDDGSIFGLRCIPPVGSVAGIVSADCPAPGTGLLGVTVDAFDAGGFLVSTAVTDASGNYQINDLVSGAHTITIVTPLGYSATSDDIPVSVVGGGTVTADFALSCVDITANPRTIGFWKHQVGVALGGRGNPQIDDTTLCRYLDHINEHFNSNLINQVVVYVPPASGLCMDKLSEAKSLLNLKGSVDMIFRAKQQLTALLLNVSSGKISLTEIISADGATVSQAITYSDNLIDDPAGNHETAKTICDEINNNRQVSTGIIPLTTANIAYKVLPDVYELAQNYPNPFNPTTEISFALPVASYVRLDIFNLLGKKVTTLVDQYFEAGTHTVVWDGNSVASGVYFYRFEAGAFVETKKMVLLK